MTMPPAPRPSRRSRVGLIAGIVAAVVLLLCGCAGVVTFLVVRSASEQAQGLDVPDPDGSDTEPGTAPTGTVRYEIEGVGTLTSLIYSDGIAAGGEPELMEVPLPWSVEVPCCADLDYALIGFGGTTRPLTCRILFNGEVVDEDVGDVADCDWNPPLPGLDPT